jgi:hypothetical protein
MTIPLALTTTFQEVVFDTTTFENRTDILENDTATGRALIKQTGVYSYSFNFSATNASASDRTLELESRIDGVTVVDTLDLTIDRLSSELGGTDQTAQLQGGTYLSLWVRQVEAGTDITLVAPFVATATRLAVQ